MKETFSWEYIHMSPWVLLGIGGVLLVLVGLGLYQDRKQRIRVAYLSFFFRIVAILWIALYFLNPAYVREVSQPTSRHWLLLVDRTPSVWLRSEVESWQEHAYRTLKEFFPPGDLEIYAYRGRGEDPIWLPVLPSERLPRGYGESYLFPDLEELPEFSRAEGVIILHDGLEFSDFPLPGNVPPLFVLIPDREHFPPRILLQHVELDAYALVRSPLRIRITLFRPPGVELRHPVQVKIWEGARLAGETQVRFSRTGDVTTTSLDLLPTREGIEGYRIEILDGGLPLPWIQSEHRLVRVLRDRVRILYLVGIPTWTSRMMREIFKEDPLLDLVTFQILRTIGDQPMVLHEDELSLIPFPIRELFTEELPKFDLVIFDNFDYRPYTPWDFRNTLILNLRQYIEESGGGFLLLLGDLMISGQELLYSNSPIGPLLPILNYGSWRSSLTPFKPSTQWGKWFQLQGMRPLLVDEYWDAQTVSTGRVVVDQEGGAPLVIVQRVQKGRVGVVLSDRLWRNYYGSNPEERASIELLYRNLVRYLTGDPAFDEFHVEWERETVLPGSQVRARILSGPLQNLTLKGKSGTRYDLFQPQDPRELRFTAPSTSDVYHLLSGDLQAPEPILVQIPLSERTHLTIPERLWKSWKERAHAFLYRGTQFPQELKEELAQRSRKILLRQVRPLTDSLGFWALGLMVIALDLILRRLSGSR